MECKYIHFFYRDGKLVDLTSRGAQNWRICKELEQLYILAIEDLRFREMMGNYPIMLFYHLPFHAPMRSSSWHKN